MADDKLEAYKYLKDSGELDKLDPAKKARLQDIYEPMMGGSTTKVFDTPSGKKTVQTQYPDPNEPEMITVERIKNPIYRGLHSLIGLGEYEETGSNKTPKQTITYDEPPSMLGSLGEQYKKVNYFAGSGTGIPFVLEKTGIVPDARKKYQEKVGFTETEIENSPGYQSFFGGLPGNVLAGEVAEIGAGALAAKAVATKFGGKVVDAATKALPTFTKVAKKVFPTASEKISTALANRASRLAQIETETLETFIKANGGKLTDELAQQAAKEGYVLPSTDKKGLARALLADETLKNEGKRGVMREVTMTPDELDAYMAERFNFVPSKGAAPTPKLLDSAEDAALMKKVGAELKAEAGTGSPDMTQFKPISPENVGGAPTKGKVGNLNINQIPTGTEDFRGWVQQIVDPNLELLQSSRLKGKASLSYDDALSFYDSLGMSADDLAKRGAGEAWAPHEAAFLQETMRKKVYPDLIALRKKIDVTDPGQKELWFRELGKAFQMQSNLAGGRSEAARTVAFAKQVSPLERMQENAAKIFSKNMANPKTQKRALELAETLDLENPEQIGAFINALSKSNFQKFSDGAFYVWINSILSSPMSHLRNVVGNTLTTMAIPAEKAASAAADVALTTGGKLMGKNVSRDRFINEAVVNLPGAAHGLRQGTRAFFNSLRGLESEIPGLPKFGPVNMHIPPIGGTTGKVLGFPGTMLRAEDDFFKSLNYNAELYSQAARQASKEGLKGTALRDRMTQIIADPDDKIVKVAMDAARERTFTSELGPIGKTVSYFTKNIPGFKYVQPFMTTGANILSYGVKRSPLGFFRLRPGMGKGAAADVIGQAALGTTALVGAGGGIGALDKIRKRENYRPASQPTNQELSAWTMAAGGLAQIYADGGLTGGAPLDGEEKKVWYASGKIPYAVKVGDQWVSYKDMGPAGVTMGMMADAMQAWNSIEQEDAAAALGMMLWQAGKTFMGQSYMSGLSDLANAYSDPKTYGPRLINRIATGFVPYSGAMKYVGNIGDPKLRRPENLKQAYQTMIPGLRESVPVLYDIWGDEVKLTGTAAERVFSPIRRSPVNRDKATMEADRLQVQPGSVQRTLDKNLELNSPAYYLAQQMRGQYSKMLVDSLVNSKGYDKLDDVTKKDVMDKMFSKAGEITRKQLGVTGKSRAMKAMMKALDRANESGDEALQDSIKSRMRDVIAIEVQGKLPKTKEPYTTTAVQSKRELE